MADAAHLTTIALSDHNTPKGIADMVRLGEAKGIRVIPAMEFDTLFEELEVHVLGYGIDYEQPYFQSLFDSISWNSIRIRKSLRIISPEADAVSLSR